MLAKKSLGQHFLRDKSVIRQIVDTLDLHKDETVVEIGPGRGALTEKLFQSGANVIAIEIDKELVPVLRNQFYFNTNFRVIEADVLEMEFGTLLQTNGPDKTKLTGNLPYYISTAILQKLIPERQLFSKIVLMLQREVVKRITAEPGNSERGFLTVITEAAFDVKLLFDVPPSAFTPKPKVWSSVVSLTPKQFSAGDEPEFRKLVSKAFAHKRKTLLNNLKHTVDNAESVLIESMINPTRRAETLTLDDWFALYANTRKQKKAGGLVPPAGK